MGWNEDLVRKFCWIEKIIKVLVEILDLNFFIDFWISSEIAVKFRVKSIVFFFGCLVC